MSRTRHHKEQKRCHEGQDWGAKYRYNRGYCGGTGQLPKQRANVERRVESKKIINDELNEEVQSEKETE